VLSFIVSHSDFNGSNISLPSVAVFTFLLVIFSTQLFPAVKRNALPEYVKDSQFPMGLTLSESTLENIYLVVRFYIPYTISYVSFFILLIRQLRAPIFASTSMLPSSIRDYTGTFFGAIKRGVLYSR